MFKCHIYQLLGLLPQMPDEKWGSESPGNPQDSTHRYSGFAREAMK